MKKKSNTIFLNRLGETLRSKRNLRDLTLRQAADAIGCNFGYLACIERGEIGRPKMKMLARLATFYELDADWVITMAGRIPEDVYWKIVDHPGIADLVRSVEAGDV